MATTLRIGLDAHMVGGRETGNESYIRGLVDGLTELDDDFELTAYHVGTPWRPDGAHLRFRRLAAGSPALRLTADLPLRTVADRLDVLHMTYAAPIWARCPVVVTVHDISYVAHPEWFSSRDRMILSTMVPISLRRAARVITVSETSRREILEHYRLAEEKVVHIPNAAGPAAQELTPEEAGAERQKLGFDPERRYLLAVGNLQPRKNLVRLIEAYRKLVARGSTLDLVIVGPRHYQGDRVLAAAREASDRIHFTGYLHARQLAGCYQAAEVFVFPSLFEGFGLPVLEAMAHGIPVACSEGGALAEVCGPAALYFDPLDVDSIVDGVERLLTSPGLRAELTRLGRERERTFSWSRSATETLRVYEEAARG